MFSAMLLLLISLFFLYWFVGYVFLKPLLLKTFNKDLVLSGIVYFIGGLILMAMHVCVTLYMWTKKKKAINLSNEPPSYGSGQYTNGQVAEGASAIEQLKETQQDVELPEDNPTSDRSREPRPNSYVVSETSKDIFKPSSYSGNKSNRKSFHGVNMRKDSDLKATKKDIEPKRFTIHSGLSNRESEYMNKQDSFIGLPEFKNFNTYLQLVTLNSPPTPLSPRDLFFQDLIEQANEEDKRRSLLYQSPDNVGTVCKANTTSNIGFSLEKEDKYKNDFTSSEGIHKRQSHTSFSRSRPPSVVEILEKNGNKLSVRASIAEEQSPLMETSVVQTVVEKSQLERKDSHDGLCCALPNEDKAAQPSPSSSSEDDDVFSDNENKNAVNYFIASGSRTDRFVSETLMLIKSESDDSKVQKE